MKQLKQVCRSVHQNFLLVMNNRLYSSLYFLHLLGTLSIQVLEMSSGVLAVYLETNHSTATSAAGMIAGTSVATSIFNNFINSAATLPATPTRAVAPMPGWEQIVFISIFIVKNEIQSQIPNKSAF